jgi:serine/threonine-protein kinase
MVPERLAAAFEGRYQLIRELGQGGMATVYLANDLKHDRQVAIKVLKPELAAVIGGERFVAEIKTTAGLQHPHILPLFDSGESDGFLFYVMPYIEGETLRDRLDRERQLGVDDALRITRDVADALDYAHRQGVIHRDIKPENILLHDGRPVVADFGIAVAISAAGGGRMTETGLSLGTPHYMSPEQATADRDLTVRSDVYSLACVLYEMLAGDPPHTGPSAQAILVRILTESPRPVDATRASVPPHIAAVLAKGLEKLPADRFDSAAEFRAALDRPDFAYTSVARATGVAAAAGQGAAPGSASGHTAGRRAPTVPVLAGIAAIFAALAAFGWLRPPPSVGSAAFTLDTRGWTFSESWRVDVAPDGRHFVTVGFLGDSAAAGSFFEPSDGAHVIIRRADESEFRSLVGPGRLDYPVFSPTGTQVAYLDSEDRAIRVVPVTGGQPTTLFVAPDANAANIWDLAWGDDGFIYFWNSDVYRIPEAGGTAEVVIEDVSWAWEPTPLPGGRAILLTDSRNGGLALRVYEQGTDSSRVLIPEGGRATWVESGHLVYAHPGGGLQAVEFDLDRLEVIGTPTPVRDGISVRSGRTFWAVSRNGTLVYTEGRTGGLFGGALAVLVERNLADGSEARVPLEARDIRHVAYAPGGDRIAFVAGPPGETDVTEPSAYTYELRLGLAPAPVATRGLHVSSAWAPDGERLVYLEWDGSTGRLMIRDVTSEDAGRPLGVSADGRRLGGPTWASDSTIVYSLTTSETPDLWMSGVGEGSVPEVYLESERGVSAPEVSPDGARIAYQISLAGESFGQEIEVRSFPEAGEPVPVSSGFGTNPKWHPDGGSIFFRRGTEIHRAFVSTEPVFRLDSTVVVVEDLQFQSWDLHPDGDRIIFSRLEGTEEEEADEEPALPERHVVVLNWFEELKTRLGR